ncbi:unnamed protein product [Trifolium pratense]|uniref:Uncharacterized protein n=1 Tax=Trifolium pratense TaxID=57577 RepID=A0ACB0MDE7_TRIPR|nr:unnamed protein product [Trifolium pratense]
MNEYVIEGDFEVMLGEVLTQPAIERLMFWGFWELFMSKDNEHLMNAKGGINESENRFLALKQDCLSHSHAHFDEQCLFNNRGFYGTFNVEIVTPLKKIAKTFVLDKM